jgi:GAF domain-containing protein
MERHTNENEARTRGDLVAPQNVIPAERFFKKLPELAIVGDEQSVDRIAYELLNLLLDSTGADIGQINLLPRGGRVEKVCIVKDGKPWLGADMGLLLYNPSKGFSGRVTSTGKTLVVEDIWAEVDKKEPNPFLEISGFMDRRYLEEIKKPVASSMFLPIKRNNEIFCTIELSRYRGKAPFNSADLAPLDDFAAQYGSVIINYLLDTKNRIALNTAYYKLNNISRLVASNGKIDYTDAVAAYRTLSAADLGFAFFRRGEGYACHALYLVAWCREEIREICFPEFKPSEDSVLCNSSEISYPVEGNWNCRRLQRFRNRIVTHTGIKTKDQQFLLGIIDKIRSYVVYPLHMLNQDLGAIHLASSRNDFCEYLHMSPFLSLYNALLKSFLLNERVVDLLSQVSLKIHNPGFYCLGGLKTALMQENRELLSNAKIIGALNCLDDLLTELHEKGKILICRTRSIHLQKWLRAWINQKRSHQPSIEISMIVTPAMPQNCHVRANYEHLETLFENLLANSMRAIAERQSHDRKVVGKIDLTLSKNGNELEVRFQDNGHSYSTVSGRGTPQMQAIMQELNGSFIREKQPYCVHLRFPYKIKEDQEVHRED